MKHAWHEHPKLKGRFHLERPDDVQVLVHDGGPRTTDHVVEEVWVRITELHGDVFTGTLENDTTQLSTVKHGTQIKFVATACDRLPFGDRSVPRRAQQLESHPVRSMRTRRVVRSAEQVTGHRLPRRASRLDTRSVHGRVWSMRWLPAGHVEGHDHQDRRRRTKTMVGVLEEDVADALMLCIVVGETNNSARGASQMRSAGSFDGRALNQRAEVVVGERVGPRRHVGGSQARARRKSRLGCRTGEFVPRADLLAERRSPRPIRECSGCVRRVRAPMLDVPVRNAAPRVEGAGPDERAGRAGVETASTPATTVGVWRVGLQVERRDDTTEEGVRAEILGDRHR